MTAQHSKNPMIQNWQRYAVACTREFLGKHLPGATVENHGWYVEIKLGDEVVGSIDATHCGFGIGAYSIEGYSIKGPHIPRAANQRYGDGKLRRKSLVALLEAALPHLRGKSAYETAREQSEAMAQAIGRCAEPPDDDECLIVAAVQGNQEAYGALLRRVDEIKEQAIACAARQGMIEMYLHFDEKFKGVSQ